MSSQGSRLSPSESTLSTSTTGSGRPSTVPAVLWGPNDDTRLLLRGLLRLYHYPVLYEARSLDDLEQLSASSETRLLLVDVEGQDGRWAHELPRALRQHPDLRPVVILPAGRAEHEAEARAAGARSVLFRPFAIREFVRALAQAIG